MRRRDLLPLLIAACGAPDEGTDRPVAGDTDVPSDSDPVAGETDATDETDDRGDPTDSDPTPDTDAGHTDVAVSVPTSFGGVFVDATAALWASGDWMLAPENPPGSPHDVFATFGDVDDDGTLEVILEGTLSASAQTAPPPILRRQPDGTWVADLVAGGKVNGERAGWTIGVLDLDGDGHNDVLRSTVGRTVTLGRGNLVFDPVDVGLQLVPGRGTAAGSMALVDVDRDGWLDLALSQQGCVDLAPLTFLWRTGLQSWEERADLVQTSPTTGGRILFPIPLDDGGTAFGLMGWRCSGAARHAGFYRPRPDTTADGLPRFELYDAVPADPWMAQSPSTSGFTLSEVAPMGAALADLDADDHLDLVVTISEATQRVFRVTGTSELEDRTADVDLVFPKFGTTEREAWGVAPVDVDLDGWPDLAIAQGDDAVAANLPPETRVSFTRLFWNDGVGRFHDVSTTLGLDATVGNWHSLAVGDLDGDLDVDLVVGGYGFLPRVWRNDTVVAGHALPLRLRGTTSNHLGVGAFVRVETDAGPPQLRYVGETASPGVLVDPVITVGLGAATIARVEVTWPSGLVQVFEDVSSATGPLVEAPTITLSELDRHLPADGVSTVDVVVTPRAPDGRLRAGVVDVAIARGEGTWAGPAEVDGDVSTRTLVAPTTAGSSVIEVTIDGVPVGIRPRIWWDAP